MPGLYLHIPFCTQACSYCDFYFVTQKTLVPAFVQALCREIRSWEGVFGAEPVETIYFGGGTPSVLNQEQFASVFRAIHETFEVQAKEITLEANPEHITEEYLQMLSELGITRLSMGVQSFDPSILSKMHRAHNSEQAKEALQHLKQHSRRFQSWSMDLIYGNPDQTIEKLEADIEQLFQFDPPHISAYSLTLEDRTRLSKEVKLGRTQMPDQDRVAEHAELVSQRLTEVGYEHYEVSSFAKLGHRAEHNQRYWNHVEYLGLGPSAHSFLWQHGPNKTPVRWSNVRDLRSYFDQKNAKNPNLNPSHIDFLDLHPNTERLTQSDLAEERIMMGFRTKDGFTSHELFSRYSYEINAKQIEWLELKKAENLVEMSTNLPPSVLKGWSTNPDVSADGFMKIHLTEAGLHIADALTIDFLSLGNQG